MKAWQIFRHALRQLTGNLKAAFFISVVPVGSAAVFAILMVGNILFLSQAELQQRTNSGQALGDFGRLAVVFIVLSAAFLWTAVAWHRFVLLNERPGWLPTFHGGRIAAYFGKGLLVALLLVIPFLLLLFLLIMLANNQPTTITRYVPYLTTLSYVLVSAIGLRLATFLPGTALGARASLTDAMTATSGNTLTFLGLVIILWILGTIAEFVTQILATASTALAIAWYLPTQWFVTLLSLSILTTLYGHYIEKRPLL